MLLELIEKRNQDKKNQTAIVWEPNEPNDKEKSFTYGQLVEEVCRFANVLKKLGVKKGEKIPASKLKAAAKKKGKLGQRARFAITLKKLRKKT